MARSATIVFRCTEAEKAELRAKADAAGVAPRLIASASELDAIASGARDLPALSGWRAEVFGNDELRLAQGRIALSASGGSIKVVAVG